MADFSVSISHNCTKNLASLPSAQMTCSADLVGSDLGSWTQTIGTDWELVAVPSDITGDREISFQNLEATGGNYVEFSLDIAGTKIFSKLRGRRPNIVSATGDIYARANGAPVVVWFKCNEA